MQKACSLGICQCTKGMVAIEKEIFYWINWICLKDLRQQLKDFTGIKC